jgi:hypothetical protein
MDLFLRAADGAGNEELLFHSDQNKFAFDSSWSPDAPTPSTVVLNWPSAIK